MYLFFRLKGCCCFCTMEAVCSVVYYVASYLYLSITKGQHQRAHDHPAVRVVTEGEGQAFCLEAESPCQKSRSGAESRGVFYLVDDLGYCVRSDQIGPPDRTTYLVPGTCQTSLLKAETTGTLWCAT